jgi:hypothetical protein
MALGDFPKALAHVTKAYYQRIMFEAMFLLAFYAFLRIGEITSRSKTYQNLLMFQHVTLHKYQSGQTTAPPQCENYAICNELYRNLQTIKLHLILSKIHSC